MSLGGGLTFGAYLSGIETALHVVTSELERSLEPTYQGLKLAQSVCRSGSYDSVWSLPIRD